MDKDIIYRQDAIDALDCINDMKEVLRSLPSAQPDIIHCRECQNWIPGSITDKDDFIPPKCGKYQQMVGHGNDDFCSLAERRQE